MKQLWNRTTGKSSRSWIVIFGSLFGMALFFQSSGSAQEKKAERKQETEKTGRHGFSYKGTWTAIIKGDEIQIDFRNPDDGDREHQSNTTFPMKDFPSLPMGTNGTFRLTREAGTMEFTGKFEGNQGMGTYTFLPDNTYSSFMNKETGETLTEEDQLVYFFIDVRKDYPAMLRSEGYGKVSKQELIPLVALKIDKAYIQSIKAAGLEEATLENLVPLKALNITGAYIRDMQEVGYDHISAEQLISFKAQDISKEYLQKLKVTKGGQLPKMEEIVAFKALKVDDAFINSFKAVGLTNLPDEQLISMKAVGVTPEYVKSLQQAGYRKLDASDLVPMKAQNITPEYIRGFEAIGYKNVPVHQLIAVKAMNITPKYISSMKAKGFNYSSLEKYITLKSLGEPEGVEN
jgi:hypothetical protein